jgi:Uma2 family endonuclease
MLPNLRVPQHILPLTDDELFELCASNSELVIERNSKGELFIISPAGGLTGNRNSRLLIELGNWNDKTGLGYVFDSSTGFLLPDKSMISPDASWIEKSRWESISTEKQEKFPPLCPDFIIELKSPSDELKYVLEKMNVWMKNGCRLAWFIDPFQKKALVYKPDNSITEFSFDARLKGGDVLPGFELDLSKLL